MRVVLVVGVVIALLSACGGGGGGSDDVDAESTTISTTAATTDDAAGTGVTRDLAVQVVENLRVVQEVVDEADQACGSALESSACTVARAGLQVGADRAERITTLIKGLTLPSELSATQARLDAVKWTATVAENCDLECGDEATDLQFKMVDLTSLTPAWSAYTA